MKFLSKQKNKKLLIICIVAGAVLYLLNYLIVVPAEYELEQSQERIKVINDKINTLDGDISIKEQSSKLKNDFNLRKQIPDNREVSELLLNLEEAKYRTGSIIDKIDFDKYDIKASETKLEGDKKDSTNILRKDIDQANTKLQESPDTLQPKIDLESLPPNLKTITVSIDVVSNNSTSFEEFLTAIDNIERIIHIDSIDYKLPGEEIILGEVDEKVKASIQFTTFYSEEL